MQISSNNHSISIISWILLMNWSKSRLLVNGGWWNWGGGAQTNWKYGRSGPSSLILFFSSERLVNGIFVKIKPNCLSSGDIALASTLISTCLSTDELLLSGTRVVENGPITRGQTYKNNIDSLQQQKWEEPAPQGQFETSQLELSLKSHAFEKFVYLHTH